MHKITKICKICILLNISNWIAAPSFRLMLECIISLYSLHSLIIFRNWNHIQNFCTDFPHLNLVYFTWKEGTVIWDINMPDGSIPFSIIILNWQNIIFCKSFLNIYFHLIYSTGSEYTSKRFIKSTLYQWNIFTIIVSFYDIFNHKLLKI